MEFLRFGWDIPGKYHGCCCFDVIQCFNYDPDTPAAQELVQGDSGSPLHGAKGAYYGMTYREIFEQRIRTGTFDTRAMPNHGFLAVLTAQQCTGETGKRWLAILADHGFEFIRAVSNSVYAGQGLLNSPSSRSGSNLNYLFGLFRNIGGGAPENPFLPPQAWQDLPKKKPSLINAVPEADRVLPILAKDHFTFDLAAYKALPEQKIYTEEEVLAALPKDRIWRAGKKSKYAGQLFATRERLEAEEDRAKAPPASAPFAVQASPAQAGK